MFQGPRLDRGTAPLGRFEKINGRHVGTRTPDLYRVNESLTSIYNNIGSTDGDRKHWKYVVVDEVVYHDVYHDSPAFEKMPVNLDFGIKKSISAVMRPNAKSVPIFTAIPMT